MPPRRDVANALGTPEYPNDALGVVLCDVFSFVGSLLAWIAPRWKPIFLSNLLLAVSTLMLEMTARRNWPASLVRPSVLFRWLGEHARWVFERLGFYLAMFTDVFYWLAELFKEDVKNLVTALAYLLSSVLYLLKGYLIYFGEIASDAYDYYAKTTTPTSLGVLGTVIVATVIAVVVYKRRAIWAWVPRAPWRAQNA